MRCLVCVRGTVNGSLPVRLQHVCVATAKYKQLFILFIIFAQSAKLTFVEFLNW